MQNQPARLAALDRATQQSIMDSVEAARPIDDLLSWLIAEYPDADRAWVFAALKAIYEAGLAIAPSSPQARTYRIGREELTACPQRVV